MNLFYLHEHELQRQRDGDEQRAREQDRKDQRQDVVPIRVGRHEVVLEKALQEVPREQPLTHDRPPRPRCGARAEATGARCTAMHCAGCCPGK